jgi:hypothetical protein
MPTLDDTPKPSRCNVTDLQTAQLGFDDTVVNDYICDALVGAKLGWCKGVCAHSHFQLKSTSVLCSVCLLGSYDAKCSTIS